MRPLQLVLIGGALVVALVAGALGVGVALAGQATEPVRAAVQLGQAHEAIFYVGYDPGLWCTVGEQRAVGLSIVDTTSGQSTRLIAIPLGDG